MWKGMPRSYRFPPIGMIRAVDATLARRRVFDNDGLLLDTESVWTRAEQDLFERRGLEFTPADKRELVGTSAAIAGGVLEAPARRARPRGGADRGAERARRRRARARGGGDGRRPRAAGDAARARHPARPRLQLAARFVRRSLEIVGLEDSFDVVLSAHEVGGAEAGARPLPGGLPAARGRARAPTWSRSRTRRPASPPRSPPGLTVIGVPSVEGVALEEAHHLAAEPRATRSSPARLVL